VKKIFLLTATLLLLILPLGSIEAFLDFNKLPETADVYLDKVTVIGLHLTTKKQFFKEIYKLSFPIHVKTWQITAAEKRVRQCGYYGTVEVKYKKASKDNHYTAFFKVVERPILTNIKIGGDFLANLEVLNSFLRKNKIIIGNIFNAVMVQKSIKSFKEHLQSKGMFLFQLRYRAKQNLGFGQNWVRKIFRISDAHIKEPIYLKLYFLKLKYFYIKKITIIGNKKIPTSAIIKQLLFRKGQMIDNNEDLSLSLWRLRRLGIFSYVFFDIQQSGVLNEAEIIIHINEIESDIVNTSISLNSRNEFNLELDYFNYSIGDGLDRISAAIIFDFKSEQLNYVFHYSMPNFLKSYFLNLQLLKEKKTDPYDDNWERIIERIIYNLTIGKRLGHYVSIYGILFNSQTQKYYERIGSTTAVFPSELSAGGSYNDSAIKLMLMFDNLDDNFFPTYGFRTFLTLGFSIFGDFDNYSLLDYKLEIYVPMMKQLTLAVYGHLSFLFTSDKEYSLSLEDRRKTSAQEDTALGLDQIKYSSYFIFEFRYRFQDQFALYVFAETGGAWGEISRSRFRELSYGIGFGFRIAPRQHYYAHIFKYPWSFNVGYNVTNKEDNEIFLSVVSSRDEFYYINLQAAF